LFFHTGNVDDLRGKIKWAVAHTDEMENLGKRAQLWVKKEFNWDNIAEQYDNLYKNFM